VPEGASRNLADGSRATGGRGKGRGINDSKGGGGGGREERSRGRESSRWFAVEEVEATLVAAAQPAGFCGERVRGKAWKKRGKGGKWTCRGHWLAEAAGVDRDCRFI